MGRKTDLCNSQAIVLTLDAMKDDTEKIDYIESVLNACGKGTTSDNTKTPNKKKRRPSGYNLFIGNCMKQDKDMKSCSIEWKEASEQEKNEWRARTVYG